ncbi:GNAT family N-acetyltransferase [Vibrio rotiferianus]|uniref:GNAT family N-acetyltransferase n=1 Tax=Vibrio rotiferianus TaxID=190895 RepID=UPI0028944F43|nr:GNAT family N-acetyltransferase [Vibrio rotiferianus]CAH1577423.1 GNAT family N-acetyltransferase [Vibrio rotiferianus]
MRFEYLLDDEVTQELDAKLRALLSTCFTKEQDKIFQTQRYFNEMPRHRYLLWDGDRLAAHVAAHEKQVMIDDQSFPICGIAEVCVDPGSRGQGLVKILLEAVHKDALERGDAFSVLFGLTSVYQSSGYQPINNLEMEVTANHWVSTDETMVRSLKIIWPQQTVHLVGYPF